MVFYSFVLIFPCTEHTYNIIIIITNYMYSLSGAASKAILKAAGDSIQNECSRGGGLSVFVSILNYLVVSLTYTVYLLYCYIYN